MTNKTDTTPAAPTFTVEQTKSMADFQAAFDAWRDADSTRNIATVDVAYATVALAEAGVILPLGGKRGTAQYTIAEYAEIVGTSESNLTQWRNLGHALKAGVDPQGQVWQDLYSSGAKANTKAVTEVLKGTGRNKPTEAKIAKALAPKPQVAGNGNTSGTRKSDAAKAKDEVKAALDMLAKALPRLSAAEFGKVPTALAQVVKAASETRKSGSKAA